MAKGIVFGDLEESGGGSAIKNIQYGSIKISAATNTATIDAVVMANSIVISNGFTSPCDTPGDPDELFATLVLTDTTTVTAKRNTTSEDITINFMVIEFATGIVKSKQTGLIQMGVSLTATVDEVDESKSMLVHTYNIDDDQEINAKEGYVKITLTDSTTITASRNYNYSPYPEVAWQLLEFN